MPKSLRPTQLKAPIRAMSADRKLELAAQFRDDVLSKLANAFFQVVKYEGWGKRDLAAISGINETAINHILAGRRKNLTIETIALLTRAMRKRPELTLHDVRPAENEIALTKLETIAPEITSKPQFLSKSGSNAAIVEVR
jgi:hypothetical protein